MATANDSGNFGDLSDFADLPTTKVGHKKRLIELDEPFRTEDPDQDSIDEFEDEKTTIFIGDEDIEEMEILVD